MIVGLPIFRRDQRSLKGFLSRLRPGRSMLLLVILLAGLSGMVAAAENARLYFFSATNCPHCKELRPEIEKLAERYPELEVIEHDIWADRESFQTLQALLETHGDQPISTPTLFLGDQLWVGMNEENLDELEEAVRQCIAGGCPDAMARLAGEDQAPAESVQTETDVKLPLLGKLDPRQVSLPLVTVVLGLVDSVNPCAFFVLLFLLSLMVHAHSHTRMLTVGLVFVFFSGLIYFLFMAAWLNLFLALGGLQYVTLVAGLVAVAVGAINIKDFVRFRGGISLSMSEQSKSRLYQKTRDLLQAGSYPALLGGTVLLAIAANSYELLCTAGFPMVFTRILTMNELSGWQYYGFLALYNVVYILPLLAVVTVFALTLGAHKLSEREGRYLKLVSGIMMVILGGSLIFVPELLNDLLGAMGLLLTALAVSGLLIAWDSVRRKRAAGK